MTCCSWRWARVGILLALGVHAAAGLSHGGGGAWAGASCGGGWVRVGGGCALPQDLAIGDQVEVSIGSVVSQRGLIIGFADCGGERTYFTSPQQQGCGWRNAITAYARRATSTAAQDDLTQAFDVPP